MMDFFALQNLPIFLLLLLVGALIGWFSRGGCRQKLLLLEEEWRSRYQSLEDEFSVVIENEDQQEADDDFNDDRDKLKSRLRLMHKGAEMAAEESRKLKGRIAESESEMSELSVQLSQKDDLIDALQSEVMELSDTIQQMEAALGGEKTDAGIKSDNID